MKSISQSLGLKLTVLAVLMLILSACNYRVFRLTEIPESLGKPRNVIQEEKLTSEYASLHSKIIAPKCLNCHRADSKSSARKLSFETYESLIENAVVPGKPMDSKLYQVLLPDAKRKMPPARSGIPALDPEHVEAIFQWIEKGALKSPALSSTIEIPDDLGEYY